MRKLIPSYNNHRKRKNMEIHRDFLIYSTLDLLSSDELYSDITPLKCLCRGCKRVPPPPSLAPSVALTRNTRLTLSTCSLVGFRSVILVLSCIIYHNSFRFFSFFRPRHSAVSQIQPCHLTSSLSH